jgi:cytochrome c-type biogenesis protein CcmH
MVAISEELRCLVCQNESLAGSRADLAKDLRREIREQIGRASPTRKSSTSWSAATATSCATGRR